MPAAQYDYAVLLLKGLGLTADEPKAIAYLKAAADKNIPGAQNRLAHIYREGVGVKKDLGEAAKWRLIAKAGGEGTDKVLDELIASLPKSDQQAAERAAIQWREKKLLPF
jgi:TPR repeat protein